MIYLNAYGHTGILLREVSKGTDPSPEFGDDKKIQLEFLRRAANFLEFIFS